MAELGALDLDFLQNIVDVHWAEGGVIFAAGSVRVAGTVAGTIENLDDHLVMSKIDVQEFFGLNGTINAASYANVGGTQPTFLLAGFDDGSTATGAHQNQVGVIVASEDGQTWTKVLKLEETRGDWQNFAAIMELVWHKPTQAFYAGVYSQQRYIFDHTITGDPIIRGVTYNLLYKSSNGHIWSKIDEQVNDGSDPDRQSPLKPYYNPHTNLPDGVSSYWEQLNDDGTIAESIAVIPSNPPIPDYLHGSVGLDMGDSAPKAITAKHFNGETTEIIALKQGNNGCYAGGVYIIDLGGELFASNDNANSWYSAGVIGWSFTNAMCGGATEDQESG